MLSSEVRIQKTESRIQKTEDRKKPTIRRVNDLKVYQLSYKAAMDIFNLTKNFPKEETYSLTDQIRRSSRSVL